MYLLCLVAFPSVSHILLIVNESFHCTTKLNPPAGHHANVKLSATTYTYIYILCDFDRRPAILQWLDEKDRRSRDTPKATKQAYKIEKEIKRKFKN